MMCLSAVYYAEISRVVFAASLSDVRALGSGDPDVQSEWLNEQAQLGLEIIAAVDRDAAYALFLDRIRLHGSL
jgi:tRNA(Arg) A34 adenosine deaminase TadA